MSYAPQSLLDARDYLRARTGLSLAALGIVGDTAHTYGYHLGRDRTSSSDYSRQTARDRAGLSNAASALDIGSFKRLRELTAYLVREARAGQLRDVRELIGPGSDGRAYRWDDLNGWRAVRRASGDSHEWHLHISYYRDSEGRSKVGPFRSFFEGTDEEDDMIGLSRGDSGEKVKGLQATLQRAGFDPGAVDGDYGPSTAAAVLAARKSEGSTVKSGDKFSGHAYAQLMTALARRRAQVAGRAAMREMRTALETALDDLPAGGLPSSIRIVLPDEIVVPIEPAGDDDEA